MGGSFDEGLYSLVIGSLPNNSPYLAADGSATLVVGAFGPTTITKIEIVVANEVVKTCDPTTPGWNTVPNDPPYALCSLELHGTDYAVSTTVPTGARVTEEGSHTMWTDPFVYTIVPAGSGGTGGSSGAGGSGGSAGTGGTAGSGGSSGTGGSGGSVSTLGDMAVTINIPVSGTHDIMVFAQDMNPQDGTVDWNDSWNQVGVHQTTYTFKVAAGDEVKVNGYYDAPDQGDPWAKQFCDPSTLKRTVSAWATFNGAYVPAPEVLSNGSGGCDLYFHAIALTPTATDSDGDGDADVDDCMDNDPRAYHGQTESFGDNLNLDCVGGNDPSRVRYRLTTISGLTPVLEDWDRNGLDYPMSSVGSGIYEVLVESPIAPKDFTIDMGTVNGWHTWDVGYNNGSCQRPTYVPVTLTVSDETSGSLYNLVTEVQPGNTCHDVVTNL